MEVRDGEKGPTCDRGEDKDSGVINLDMLKKSGKDPCGVCQTGVGSNAIFCGGCKRWVHKKCSGIRDPCALTLSSGVHDAFGLLGLLMKEEIQRLRFETKSLKVSQRSATLGTCSLQEVVVSWLRSHAGNLNGACSTICPF